MYTKTPFLGMLTKQYPEIALSIKTRQASRSVLNQMRDGVQELTMDGIIEEAEGHKIEKVGDSKHILTVLLGMLTKKYPDIALSIKTRQASRSVLNQMRDGVQELTMDGIIEEAEGHKIEKVGDSEHMLTFCAHYIIK